MKKWIALLLCLTLVLALAACANNAEDSLKEPVPVAEVVQPAGSEEITGPMTEYASLAEINKIAGSKLEHPGVMGVTDEKFFINNGLDQPMAIYQFSVNGNKFEYRCAAVGQQDISGLFADGKPAFPPEPAEDVEYAMNDDFKACRWFTMDGQYVLILTEGTMDEDTFKGVADELRSMTAVGPTQAEMDEKYNALMGDYQDSVSQRATMQITPNEDGEGVLIMVHWSSSATQATEWIMTGKIYEDGLLSYKDCLKMDVTVSDKGEVTDTQIGYTDGEGFFSPTEDGKLLWNGAADAECTECLFEKLPA